jgi:hypothetical protein
VVRLRNVRQYDLFDNLISLRGYFPNFPLLSDKIDKLPPHRSIIGNKPNLLSINQKLILLLIRAPTLPLNPLPNSQRGVQARSYKLVGLGF